MSTLVPMANLRERQKEETRRRLLAAALERFQEQGYVATTVDHIASAVGTTRVTFYAHFGNKTEVMRALFDDLNVALDRGPSPLVGSTATLLVEAVRDGGHEAIYGWLVAQASRWPEIGRYLAVVSEAAAVDPEINELKARWWSDVIADIVEGLDAADRFRPESRLFRGYMALECLNSACSAWIRDPWPLTAEAPQFAVLADAWMPLVGRTD